MERRASPVESSRGSLDRFLSSRPRADFVSVGALTHSASADLIFEREPACVRLRIDVRWHASSVELWTGGGAGSDAALAGVAAESIQRGADG